MDWTSEGGGKNGRVGIDADCEEDLEEEASAALCVICGRISLASCRTTARVPSCNFFWAGVKSGSIFEKIEKRLLAIGKKKSTNSGSNNRIRFRVADSIVFHAPFDLPERPIHRPGFCRWRSRVPKGEFVDRQGSSKGPINRLVWPAMACRYWW